MPVPVGPYLIVSICEIATNMPRYLTQGRAMTVLDYIEIVCPKWFGCQIAGGEITEKKW
jgi:hypothetical protein